MTKGVESLSDKDSKKFSLPISAIFLDAKSVLGLNLFNSLSISSILSSNILADDFVSPRSDVFKFKFLRIP